jgi:hypothetical protein
VTKFIESACWSDDIKKYGLYNTDSWHYENIPIDFNQTRNYTYDSYHALETLKLFNKSLHKWDAKEIKELDTQLEKSIMTRFLIHIIGDIHQPLHAVSLFNEMFPDGDEGGNLFLIKLSDNINNLHKLYDSVFGMIPELKRVYITYLAFR